MVRFRALLAALCGAIVFGCSGSTTTGGTGGTTGSGGAATGGSGASATGGAVSSGGSAGGGGIQCVGVPPVFPEFDRSCTADADCIQVQHVTSCCGSAVVMGIAQGAKADFDAAEAICDAQYPGCGCATQGINVEDGTLIDVSQLAQVVATCDSGSCAAHYTGETFPCQDARCTPEQICWITLAGQAGGGSTAQCQFGGGCTDCSCVTNGCSCQADSGHLTVTCAAP